MTIHPVIVNNPRHTSQVDEEAKVEAVKAFYENRVVDHGRVKTLNFISKNIDMSHLYLSPPSKSDGACGHPCLFRHLLGLWSLQVLGGGVLDINSSQYSWHIFYQTPPVPNTPGIHSCYVNLFLITLYSNHVDHDSIFTVAAAAAKSDLDQTFDILVRVITGITSCVQAS